MLLSDELVLAFRSMAILEEALDKMANEYICAYAMRLDAEIVQQHSDDAMADGHGCEM